MNLTPMITVKVEDLLMLATLANIRLKEGPILLLSRPPQDHGEWQVCAR